MTVPRRNRHAGPAAPDADADPPRARRRSPACLVSREAAEQHADRGHGRRPRRRPPAGRLQRRVGRVARAGRGRRAALHADLPGPDPGQRSGRSGARASTTSSGRPSSTRCTSTTAARPRPSRRSPATATASGSTTPTASAGRAGSSSGSRDRFAPHNVMTDGEHLREARQADRRGGRPDRAGLVVRAGGAARATPDRRRRSRSSIPTSRSRTSYDPADEPLPPLHQRLEDAPGRRRRRPGRGAHERRDPADVLRPR